MPTILLTAKRLQSKSNRDKKHQNKNFVSSFLPSPPLRLLPPPFIPDKWLNLICSFDTSHLGLSELWHKSVLVWNGFLSKNWKKNIIKCSSVNSLSTAWRSNLSCLPSSFTAVPCLHSPIIPSHLRAPSSLLHSFCFTPPSIWACPSPSADSPLPPSSKCPIYKVGGNSEETVQCERYSRGSASHTPNSNATPSAALARSHISAVAVPLMADVTTQREEKNKQKNLTPSLPFLLLLLIIIPLYIVQVHCLNITFLLSKAPSKSSSIPSLVLTPLSSRFLLASSHALHQVPWWRSWQ